MAMKNSVKRTNTTLFLLPLLGISRSYLTNHNDWFINAYLNEDSIELIYKYQSVNVSEYKMFTPAVEETIKYFSEGKYSKIANHHKQTILNFWNSKKGSRLYNILYPENFHLETTGRAINAEIWPKPNMEEETL
jgi:hypothetical protein